MGEWISVDDKLPEEYDWVLASAVSNKDYKLRFVPYIAAIHNGKWAAKEVFDSDDIENWDHVKITHWMPLPDSPRD